MMNLAGLPVPHDDGHFISTRISQIVELIRDYDHRLDVKWIPPEQRAEGEAAFAIIERLPNGKEVIAFHVEKEEDFDERVLERIYLGDTSKVSVEQRVQAQNDAAKALQRKNYQEFLDEQLEIARAVFRSPKDKYVGPNGKIYRA